MSETAHPGTPRSSGFRRRLFVQILAMVVVAFGTGGIILSLQFQSAVENEDARLSEVTWSRARLLEVIIQDEMQAGGLDPSSDAFPLALSQLSAAHLAFSGFGDTGEFTFAERVGDSLHFLLNVRHSGSGSLLTLPMDSDLAEPMRRALSGEGGTLRGLDYRGVEVLAAYQPLQVEGLALGLVAKVDYSEFRDSLIATGLKAGLFAFLLIGLGAYLIGRVGNPLIRALEESERRYRQFFEDSPEAILITRPDGTVLECNAAAGHLFRSSVGEVVGTNAGDFYQDPEQRAEMMGVLRAEGQVRGMQLDLIRPDGSTFICLITAHLRAGIKGGEESVEVVLTDISELCTAQEARIESEDRLRALYDSVQAGVILQASSGEILHANSIASEILGMNAEEIEGRDSMDPTWEMIDEDGNPVSGEDHPSAITLRTGVPIRGAVRGLFSGDPDRTRWLIINTEPTRFGPSDEAEEVAVTFLDITEFRKATAALKESEERAQRYLDVAEVMLIALDTEGRIEMINRKGCELLEASEPELVGLDWFENFLPSEVVSGVREVFDGVISGQIEGLEHFENEVVTATGKIRKMAWYNSPLRTATGEIEGLLSSGEDITARKLGEEALAESEARYRALFEDSPIAIWEEDFSEVKNRMAELRAAGVVDLRPYLKEHQEEVEKLASMVRVLGVNNASLSVFGVSSKEELLRSILWHFTEGSFHAFREEMVTLEAGKTHFEFETPIRDGSGLSKTLLLSLRVFPGCEEGWERVLVSFIDITKRKRAEGAVREALAWQRATIEGSGDAIFISDSDARLVLVNRAASELTGYSREQLLEMTIPDLHEEVDLSAFRTHFDEIMAGTPALTEAPILRADGTKVDTEFNNRRLEVGGFPYMHTVARDLTERREMERVRKENEARLKLAQQVGRVGLLDRDLVRDVEVWSETTYEILGLDPEKVAPGPSAWLSSIHPDDRLKATRFLGQLLHGEESPGEEYRVVHANGEVRWVRGVARVFLNPEGSSVIRILATVQDITSEKGALDAVEASEARLRALAARLAKVREEERTSISRELHDEVGQTLTGLRMDLSMERSELPAEAVGQRERFTRLIESTDANIDFVRELSSRLRPPILDVMGLGPALEWLIDDQRARTEVNFHLDLPESGPNLPSEEGISLYRIAQESLTNIFRHAGASNVWVSLREEGGFLNLVVEDDGVGVPLESTGLPTSLGLLGMTERAMAISGDFVIGPREEGGARVRVTLPFPIPLSIHIPIPGQEGELP